MFSFIRYTENFSNYLLSAQWIVIPARMIVACSLERIWIAQGSRHRPDRQNSWHGITLIVIDPFAWIEPVAHLSERKVLARVKWISVTSRLSCRVLNPQFGNFGKFGFWENSAFGKNRPSDNIPCRTYAILHCLNQIRIFYNFLV